MNWGKSLHNEAIFKDIVQHQYAQLCALSVQFTDSIAISEDLVQDVLLRFWEDKKYHLAASSIRAYLFTAVRNASIDYIRKNKLHIFTSLEESIYLPEEQINAKDLEEQYQLLHQLLEELSPQEHAVLLSIVVDNKKYKEVAQEMGITVNTVKTYLSRAMKFLRKKNIKLLTLFLFY